MPRLDQMTEQYAKDYEQGVKYQDFVTDKMYELGIPLVGYSSMEYQHKKGEGRGGVEIKNDTGFRETGNLYIEVADRVSESTDFTPGGVMRDDNSWLFVIGDYKTIYIFSKNQLARMYKEGRYPEYTGATSKAMLLPIDKAGFLVIRKIEC